MADVSHLQPHGNDDDEDEDEDEEEYDDDRDQVVVSFNPDNNCSCDLVDGFDLYPSDLDFFSFDGFLSHTDRNPTPNENDSVLFDRENQMNFVIDMFHQRVEQSQSHSASRVIIDSDSGNPNRNLRLIEGNEGTDANELDRDFDLGLGLGFPVEVNNNRNNGADNSGFMLADCGDDDFFVSRTTLNSRSESENPSNRSIGPEYITGGFRLPDLGSDTDIAGENNIDFETEAGCEVESNLRLSWDAFQLEDDNERGNQDFEWEEIDDRINEREILNMIFESEADDDLSVLPEIPTEFEEQQQPDTSSLEWEVLLNIHNLEGTQDLADGGGHYDEYNYAEYDMLFEQFADADVSSLGRPPAARSVVENLLTVVMNELDLEKNNTLCAVCKDEIGVGLMGKQLPCGHRYHGDCIVPWLNIRNTCPVCRHELQTDDLDYERRRAERSARDR